MIASDPPLELLLSDAADRTPVLDHGLPASALLAPPAPGEPPGVSSLMLDAPDRDPNALALQRWGVVAPEGPAGDRMLAAIEPLIRHREAEQGAPARIFRVPPGLSLLDAMRWRDRHLRDERLPQRERPRYLLLLGDLEQTSLELQHTLAHGGCVGRLSLADDDAHAAYAAKVVAWEHTSRELPRLLSFTVHDGTSATGAGHRHLMRPCSDYVERERQAGALALADAVTIPHDDDPRPLLGAAAASEASLLLSLSHGLGAPRRGWTDAAHQRRTQGALCLGPDCAPLTAETLAGATFLPGGLWLMIACFGAGTPATSAYAAWLASLPDRDEAIARDVLRSLPGPGEPPFLAALPRAALASPHGPLAVIAHIDLAWTFAFTDDRTTRASRIFDTMRAALAGARFGVALDVLMESYRLTNDDLTNRYQLRRDAARFDAPDPTDDRQLASLWMRRNDLRGYVLLGDPAAHLPLTRALARADRPLPAPARPPVPEAIHAVSRPVPEATRPAAPAPDRPVLQDNLPPPAAPPIDDARAPAPPLAFVSAPEEAAPRDSRLPAAERRRRERAVLALLRGADPPQAIAARHGVDLDDLFDWLERYRDHGRHGLGDA